MRHGQDIPLGHPETHSPENPKIEIYSGLNEHFASQLIEKSRQETMLRYVPDDASRRFKDDDSINQWLTNRDVFLLTDGQSLDLGGIIWYGPKGFPQELPNHLIRQLGIPSHTFAIRLYDGYRGQGLAKDFMRETFGAYMWHMYQQGQLRNYTGLWLRVSEDNPAAIQAYTDFGFVEAARDDENHIIFMILSRKTSEEILSGV